MTVVTRSRCLLINHTPFNGPCFYYLSCKKIEVPYLAICWPNDPWWLESWSHQLLSLNSHKASDPDGLKGRTLKNYEAKVHSNCSTILGLTFSSSCWKTSTITPVPEKATPLQLNDYGPVWRGCTEFWGTSRVCPFTHIVFHIVLYEHMNSENAVTCLFKFFDGMVLVGLLLNEDCIPHNFRILHSQRNGAKKALWKWMLVRKKN